ncbi:MAG TPA: PQQ-binding-like beta-propeller repeat protein [Planctomycetota bacterium]|nr:PQQ-binding-like beta-propeller repeat protein [Planctomycetota bacterium]
MRRHDAATGATLWTVPAGGGSVFSTPVVGGGRVFVAAPGMVQAVNLATQSVDWTLTGYTILWTIAPAYADGVLYVVNAGTILAVDAATGKPVWSFTDTFSIEFPPVVANNHLFVSSRNEIYGINLGTREVVFKEINSWGGPLAVAEGKLLVARVDGLLKAYTLSAGSLPNQGAPPAAPQSLTVQAAGTGSAQLAWSDASSNETGFRLERSTDGANFSLRTEFGAGATSFLDTGLVHPTAYTYRMVAFNAAGSSSPSNTVQIAPSTPGNGWLMLGNNPQHTGVNANETGKPPAMELWTWPGGTQSVSPVVTEDGRVFTSNNSSLVALDGATGAVLWTHGYNGGYAAGPPAVQNGRVYYQYINGQTNSKLFCLIAATGRVVWGSSFYTQSSLFPAPVIADGRAYITAYTYNFVLDAYDADDGRQLWGNSGGYIPAVQSGTVYTHYGDQFRALEPATGNALWTTALPTASTPTLSATRGYGTTNRDLYSLNLATHALEKVIPSGNLNNYYTEPSIAGGVVYWVTDGILQARRESDLRVQWSFAGDGTIRTRPVIANGYVYVSSTQNTYILSELKGKLAATIPAGGAVSVASGRLYIAGLDGTLRAYRLSP